MVGIMDITVAYFHSLFYPENVKRDFEKIRAMGAGSVVYAIHEQEEQRWPRDFERGFRLAQEAGLKVYLSLGRFGNLFAGPLNVPSWYTFRHRQSRVKDRHGTVHDMTCFNSEDFRSWLFKEVEHYVTTYPVAGLVLDEPCVPNITCFCSVCRALCPDIADLQHFRRRSMIQFFDKLFSHAKHVKPRIKTNIVLLPQDFALVDELASISTLDTIGGHLFWQLLGEDVGMVERWSSSLVKATRRAGKRSQLWLQNFNIEKQAEKALEPAFNSLIKAEPDDIACYYFWRNNDNPEQVWQTTCSLLRRIPRRQLYWQPAVARVPVATPPVKQEEVAED
jgi:hypothetical protein